MDFWKSKSFWVRECALGVIFLILSFFIFIRTHDLGRASIFFIEIFAFIQPFLLMAYFIDKKFGGRRR